VFENRRLRIHVHHGHDHVTVEAHGEIDVSTAHRLHETLHDPFGRYVFDLSDVTFMDSAGVHALAAAAERVSPAGEIVVRGAKGMVRRLLNVCNMDRLVTMDDSA
jgi:anti-anti-sigma factor